MRAGLAEAQDTQIQRIEEVRILTTFVGRFPRHVMLRIGQAVEAVGDHSRVMASTACALALLPTLKPWLRVPSGQVANPEKVPTSPY